MILPQRVLELNLKFTSIKDDAFVAFSSIADRAHDMVHPTVRLGVTGLSRAGKTVFISSLVHNLINGGKLPMFPPMANHQIKRAYLQPQPDDDIPRFTYEEHIKTLSAGNKRDWPSSTSQISQLRLTIEYEPQSFISRRLGYNKLNIDIIDYPGEWLLDLPMLDLTYEEWSAQTLEATQKEPRKSLATKWLKAMEKIDPKAESDEEVIQACASSFTDYLQSCRDEEFSLSTVPPGRFLMPGDLAGSPLITFCPLDVEGSAKKGSLHAMMQRRYNSYVSHVVKPFFLNHFSRIDRQIVLVDTLAALNAGSEAVGDLKNALKDILKCFKAGQSSLFSLLFGKKIDKVLFAATKADHLHHTNHDKLENILRYLVDDAIARSHTTGAKHNVVALASVRATRELMIDQGSESLPAISGTPEKGQTLDGETYNGKEEIALFPGDLPSDPLKAFDMSEELSHTAFLRFRPPLIGDHNNPDGTPSFPHIRLDKAMSFLLGDYFS